MESRSFSTGLTEFLSASLTGFHAVTHVVDRLVSTGFAERSERDTLPGSGSFFIRRGGAVVAIRPGTAHPSESGFRVAAAHTDSPGLRLKIEGAHDATGGTWVPVEVYGGPILSTWLDRELLLAGRAVVHESPSGERGWRIRTFQSRRPMAIIPNLAIHLNRDVNKGFEYNAQDHLQARLALSAESAVPAPERIRRHIADVLDIASEQLGAVEAYLVDAAEAVVLDDETTLVSGRIDNLVGCYSCLEGFIDADPTEATQVLCLFDNEEIGSRTGSGADSPMLDSILRRLSVSNDAESWYRAVAASFIVSNDGAHALHDRYSGKYDSSYSPVLGAGPVLKVNSQYRYATTIDSMERTREAADESGITLQMLAGRSDMRTGSTIGPISWTRTGISTVDLGVPMLAMHSIREVCDIRDASALSLLVQSLLNMK
ncbi:MAG: M18 family aminopeptidase [Spirochaetaceae bacterium]